MPLPRLVVLLVLLLLFAPPAAAPLAGCDDAAPTGLAASDACCRVCTTGKACGDSCIARGYTCRREPGCACDAGETRPEGERTTVEPRAERAAAPPAAAAAAGLRFDPRTRRAACTVERIIDGDTYVCEGGERVRLLLVDAPERSQGDFGSRATRALSALLPVGSRSELELDVRQRDRYGRVLAYVHTPDGRMVNEELARQGYVVVSVHPPNIRHVERMRAAVAEAREARRGLWSGSAFDCEPAEHRAGRCE